MAVTFDGTRVNAADAIGSLWLDLGGGKTNLEPDFLYQRSSGTDGAISEKVGTSAGGVKYYDSGTSNDFTSAHASGLEATWIVKHIATNKDALNNEGATGGILEIGSGDRTNYYQYYIVGGDTYPKRGGWLISAINPNVTAWRDATTGTPTLTAIDNYAWQCDFGATSKAENVAIDALDFIRNGQGLTWTGTGGNFDSFVSFDEGTLSNSYGIVQTFAGTVESGVGVTGTLTIGSSTATTFTDSNKSLFFFGGRVAAGFAGIVVSLANTSNTVTWNNCSFTGLGQSNVKRFFDTTSQVNGTTEVISFDIEHGFLDGNAVLYSKEGGTAAIGLTDATEYFVNAITASSISLHTSRQNAISDTSRVNLTASGTENHSLTRQPDTRPDLTVTSTTGVGLTANNCLFNSFRGLDLNSKATLSGCNIVATGRVDLGTGTAADLTNCSLSEAVLTEGNNNILPAIAQVVAENIATISGCDFTFNEVGHAVMCMDTTASPFNFSGNTFTGYWAPTDGGAGARGWEFQTTSGVAGGTEIITMDNNHGFSTGDAVWYNKHGGTAAVGLTDGNKYYVNVLSATTLSLHRSKNNANGDTNRIDLTAAGSETHSLYSNNAALCNNAGGDIVVNITGGGGTPSVRNIGNVTTTVNNNVTVTFDKMKDNTEVRIYDAGTGAEIAGIENATAGTTDNRNFAWSDAASNVVNYVIHNVAGWETIRVEGFTVPTTDTTIDIQQRVERNYSNP